MLFRIYLNLLLKGNPLAVIPTAIVVVVLGFVGLSDGLSKRDPVAIGVLVVIGLMFLTLLVVGVVDRKLNPDPAKARAAAKARAGAKSGARPARR